MLARQKKSYCLLLFILYFGQTILCTRLPVDINVDRGKDNFKLLVKNYSICSNPNFNLVYARRDGYGIDFHHERNWSMHSETMRHFVGIADRNKTPYCSNVKDVVDSSDSLVIEQPCRIKWMDTLDMCSVIGKYDYIAWHGDSLVRHMDIALHMLLRENYENGGIQVPNFPATSYSKCVCDGQYSEMVDCRHGSFSINFKLNEGMMMCRNLTTSSFITSMQYGGVPPLLPEIDICDPQDKDKTVFLLYSQSVHFHMDGNRFIKEYLHPILENIKLNSINCMHKFNFTSDIKIVIIGAGVSSQRLSEIYESQSHPHVANYNREIKQYIKKYTKGIEFIDPYNWTLDAIDDMRTSDGEHFLSDVNSMKVMTVLNLMNLMLDSNYNKLEILI